MFTMYANQKVITINRNKVKAEYGNYLNIYESSVFDAMKNLTHSAFKVYMCLVSNKDKYRMALSPAAIKNQSGLCIDTVRKAIKELEIKGYIEFKKTNEYAFYEVAKEVKLDRNSFI